MLYKDNISMLLYNTVQNQRAI